MPRDDDGGGGFACAVSWTRRWWRALVGEVVSTALLVALGVASLLPTPGGDHVPLTHPALGFGFIVAANVQAFGAVSGAHMNPAVTLAALVLGHLSAALALAYTLAQLLGAVLGFGALLALAAPERMAAGAGCTAPPPGVAPAAAAAAEALITGVLVLTCCGLWAGHDPARPDHSAPVKLGITVAGLVYAGGFLSSASLNPARSLAPALLQNCWDHHWVYWVGPLGGAALSALLYRWVLLPPAPNRGARPGATAEELPLHDKPDH